MAFAEMLEVLRILRHCGVPPMRALKKRDGKYDADIIGIGDNGLAAVNHLIEAGYKNAAYLVLHREGKKRKQTKADTIAMKNDSWAGIENFLTAPFDGLPKSYRRFLFYYSMNLQHRGPSFVLADFSESDGRDAAPAAAKSDGLFPRRKIAVVHVPMLEKLTDKDEAGRLEPELRWRFQGLCQQAHIVIAMGDGLSHQAGMASEQAKRQSDFVGDLLCALHGDEEMRLSWRKVCEFLSVGRLPRWGNLWQAWSSEAADVRSAMADVQRVLSCGGALQATKRVFVMITGKEGELSLSAVQKTMDELSALLDKQAEVLLHVNSERQFDAGVRINMAVQVERVC